MIKLSELKGDVKIMSNSSDAVYTVEDVKEDLQYYKDEGVKFYTTTEYQASINATDVLESAIESESDNMYENWYEQIVDDITDEDIQKMQTILNDILDRSKDQNIAYYKNKEIEIDI